MPDAEGNPTTPERCERAFRALLAYSQATGPGEDIEIAMGDLMADMRHLCDESGYDWDAAVSSADMHYTAERTGIEPPVVPFHPVP